jgi:hypothetical protein
VITSDPSGHNIGELRRRGVNLTTREVLALTHEICRDATAALPQSPDDLWITDTSELLIARSDQIAPLIDPRHGVASLLEAMLPPEGAKDPAYVVPAALRGLPTRLRASADGVGPRDRKDLMSILSWHLDADPREVIEQLVARVGGRGADAVVDEPSAAAAGDLDLFPDSTEPPAPSPAGPRIRGRMGRAATVLALFAAAAFFIAIGSASYWLSRVEPDADAPSGPRAVVTPVESPPPTVPPLSVRVPNGDVPPQPALVTTGAPQPLALDVVDGAFSPTFAITGSELLFHAGRANAGRLLMADLDGQGQVARISAVRTDAARNYHPRMSPDGRWIAFDSDRDGERGVYVAARDGSDLQRVSGPGYGAVPSWSPDMKSLAFIRGEPARPRVWNLWLRDLSNGALRRLTAFRSGQVWGASWFPDGRSVCYSHDEQLIISHLDSREDIVIDSPRRGHLVRTPAVSPDGRRVVFQVFRDGVWLLDVNTRSMRRILDDATAEEFAWSPEGGRIAYHSRRDGEWKIWVMPIER